MIERLYCAVQRDVLLQADMSALKNAFYFLFCDILIFIS